MDEIGPRLARNLDAAFPELVALTRDGLYSGVRRLVPQTADAEDICAEAFLRAYRSLATMSPSGDAPSTSPRGCGRSPSTSPATRRGGGRGKPWVELDPQWQGAAGDSSPEVTVVTRSHVTTLLEELPTGQRTAVVLRHIVGLTYAEIAAATGRPEGSIKADVSRGMERLRRTESP